MNLAFYYHIPLVKEGNSLFCPGFLGVFLDSIAAEVNRLTLVMHESQDRSDADYKLLSANITFISLGAKTAAWHRMLMHKKILKKKLMLINNCDLLLVRSPTPLAPYFKKYIETTSLNYLVVGDYGESAKLMKVVTLKDFFVKLFLVVNNFLLVREVNRTHTIVNSRSLYGKYKKEAASLKLVKTTTLSASDFFKRQDTCLGKKINILYTGRIEWEKGLRELVVAFSEIKFQNSHLNIVGWEKDSGKRVENELRNIAHDLGIEENITFHGYKKVGNQLNEMYRMADIYVMPSYHEGFPRTIWEAMGNSLPVIATSVGAIPFELIDGRDALLINPRSTSEIKNSIERLIVDSKLRKCLIKRGALKASDNTLERQSLKLIAALKVNDYTRD